MLENKYHFVYVTTNKVNGHFYIGKHSTTNLNDNYLGSGKILRLAIKKYGRKNFKRRIICFCKDAEEAYKVELFIVTDYITSRHDCYNMKLGGEGGLSVEPWNKGLKNAYVASEETRKKLSSLSAGANNGMYGKHHTTEAKLKMSECRKGKTPWNKGKHLELTDKQKQAYEKMKGRTPWNKGLKLH